MLLALKYRTRGFNLKLFLAQTLGWIGKLYIPNCLACPENYVKHSRYNV